MIHNIRFREFVYESENLDELTQAIYNIFPDAEIESEDAEGLMEDKIIILSGVVDKKRQTKAFFNLLLELDQNQLDKLNNDLERKVDDKGNLFLRLSKEDAVDGREHKNLISGEDEDFSLVDPWGEPYVYDRAAKTLSCTPKTSNGESLDTHTIKI